MPLVLSSTAIEEKNKLGTDSIWHILIEVQYPTVIGYEYIRCVRYGESITWRGHTWMPANFELDEISDTGAGESPEVSLKFSNTNKQFQAILGMYDTYCKTYGIEPINCSIYYVNSKDLANTTPVAEYTFVLKRPHADSKWATFVLGASSFHGERFPKGRVLKDQCRFKYETSGRCNVAVATKNIYPTCDKTLAACRIRNNSSRFGGFPGVGFRGLKVAV